MTRLSLALLGLMQLTLDGQPVGGFAYHKARALLAYLAVEVGRPHHRDTLAALLWPEVPDEAARHNLRQALANLRAALGDASATTPFLQITRDTLQLNPHSDCELDVSRYTALLAACESHTHRHLERCRSCAARMEQALALYRGDFLAGVSMGDSAPFEEWQLRHRERLHQQALDTLARLASYYERRGEGEPARRYAQRQIELEPWREEAHRQLMRLLARGGQRSAALAQYATCRRILARDLGVEPEAETAALYKEIRDRETGSQGDNETNEPENGQPFALPSRRLVSAALQHHFPAQTTPLIGRENELADLGALLEDPARRLITIVGPGGIGKTRLALAAAAEQAEVFADGAAFVPLQAISAPAFATPAILSALDIPLQGQRDPRVQLLDYLRGKELLLVLDNAEQLLAADQNENDGITALLSAILAHASGITLLVTSRERLALPGEWLFDLAGLRYPLSESAEGSEIYSAVHLFLQRAGQVRRQFTLSGEAHAVARICRLVEGLPLAIELAAAALRTRSVTAIAAAIESDLSALSTVLRAIPERQRSIWATFEHSWRLLSVEERQVFAQLSVFRGGFEEDAAAQVAQASPQLLAALLDKSLLRWDGVARYDMHELVRQYAGEKLLEGGKAGGTRQQHAQYYLALAEAAEPGLWEVRQHEGSQARLLSEHDNLRAALTWSQGPEGSAVTGLRLVGALGKFWFGHGHLSEGRAWLASALAQPYPAASSQARAKALGWAGWLAQFHGDGGVADAYYDEALALSRAIGDRRGTALRLHDLGLIAMTRGKYAHATILLQDSLALFRALGDRYGSADVLMLVGVTARSQGDYVQAMMLFEESLGLWRELGDNVGVADVLDGMGRVTFNQGDYVRAAALYQEALALARQAGHHHLIAMVRSNLGRVLHEQGEHQQGLAQIKESVAWFREAAHKEGLAWALLQLSAVLYTQGQDVQAKGILREALILQQENNRQGMISESLELFAGLAIGQRQPERAARLFGAAEALRETIGAPLSPVERLKYAPNLAAARAQLNNMTFAAAWAEGRAMVIEQAIAIALEDSEVGAVYRTTTTVAL